MPRTPFATASDSNPRPNSQSRSRLLGMVVLLPVLLTVLALNPAAHAQAYYACFGSGTAATSPIASCPAGGLQSQLTAISIGGYNQVSLVAGVQQQGLPSLQGMSIQKSHDTVSDTLFQDSANSTLLPSIVISCYAPGAIATSKPLYTFVLTNVWVSAWQLGWGSPSTSITESASLIYEKLTVYNNVTGQTVTWNIQTGKPTVVPARPR